MRVSIVKSFPIFQYCRSAILIAASFGIGGAFVGLANATQTVPNDADTLFLLPKNDEASQTSNPSRVLPYRNIDFVDIDGDASELPGVDFQEIVALYSQCQTKSGEGAKGCLNGGDAGFRACHPSGVEREPIAVCINDSDEFYRLAQFIESQIRNAGYVFAQVVIPPQEIDMRDIRIRFLVVAGTIESVAVCDGEDLDSLEKTSGDGDQCDGRKEIFKRIERTLEPLKGGGNRKPSAANIDRIEARILRAQSIPGVKINPILSPSANVPGGIDMRVLSSVDHWSGEIVTDNRGSDYAGPWQVQITGRMNSYSEFGEQIEASVFRAWPNHQRFAQLSGGTFLFSDALRWRASIGAGQALPGGVLQVLGYRSQETVGSARLEWTAYQRRNHQLLLVPEAQITQSRAEVADPASPGQYMRQSDANVRSLRFQAHYNAEFFRQTGLFGDEAAMATPTGFRMIAAIQRGLPVFGATTSQSVYSPRPGADGVFTKYTLDADIEPQLYQIDTDKRIGARISFSGQFSDQALLPSEKFFAGGYLRGRGYYAGQITGDSGYFVGGELYLSKDLRLSLDDPRFSWPSRLQLYGFYNFARTFDAGDFDVPKRMIASWGAGSRLFINENTELEGEAAYRIKLNPLGENGQELHPWAGFVRLVQRF